VELALDKSRFAALLLRDRLESLAADGYLTRAISNIVPSFKGWHSINLCLAAPPPLTGSSLVLPRTPNPTFCAAIRISAEKRLKRSREQDDLAPYVTLLQLRKSRADAVQRKSGRDRYFQVTGGDQPGEFSEDSGVFRFAAL